METQIEKAKGVTIDDTNIRILSHKDLDYCYGVFINTICKDLQNDTEEMRIELLRLLRDFQKNISYDLMKYIKGDGKIKYETSLSMRGHVGRLAHKIHDKFNKNGGFFANIKVRCVVESCRHLLELKEYLLIEGKK